MEPHDSSIVEEWERDTSEPDIRGIGVTRDADGTDWPWHLSVSVAEFVREEPLEGELRRRMDAALRAVPGVSDVAEEDREVWIIRGDVSGEAIAVAAAQVVDEMADRIRAAYFD